MLCCAVVQGGERLEGLRDNLKRGGNGKSELRLDWQEIEQRWPWRLGCFLAVKATSMQPVEAGTAKGSREAGKIAELQNKRRKDRMNDDVCAEARKAGGCTPRWAADRRALNSEGPLCQRGSFFPPSFGFRWLSSCGRLSQAIRRGTKIPNQSCLSILLR